jgi:hypothetical protein
LQHGRSTVEVGRSPTPRFYSNSQDNQAQDQAIHNLSSRVRGPLQQGGNAKAAAQIAAPVFNDSDAFSSS